MKNKIRKNMGLSLLPLSFIFLFNPDLAIFDVLPDFIGYLVLFVSLTNISDINYHIADARNAFKKGILFGILKLLSIVVTYALFGPEDQPIMLLLFTFVFSVLDFIYIIYAFKKLFEGLLYAGQLSQSDCVYKKSLGLSKEERYERRIQKLDGVNGKKADKLRRKLEWEKAKSSTSDRNITVKAASVSVRFIILKDLAALLPEFTVLINNSEYEFVGLLRLIGVGISLLSGIDWLIYMFRYFAVLRSDRLFIDELEKKYQNEAAPNVDMFTKRNLHTAIVLISAGFVLSVDLYSEYINYLPDLLASLLMIVGILCLKNYSSKWKPALVWSVVSTVLSAAAYGVSLYFYTEYFPSTINVSYDAYVLYYIMLTLYVLSAAVFVIMIYFILRLLLDIAKKHTGRVLISDDEDRTGISGEIYRDIKKRAVACFVLSVIAEAGMLFYIWSQPFSVDLWFMEAASVISVVLSMVFAAFSVFSLMGSLQSRINDRYSLS